MTLRLYVEPPLLPGTERALPEAAARHVQVRRAQPGDGVVLFDGQGHEAEAQVLTMGRREVTVRVVALASVERELPLAVTLAMGMPGNDRMDALVEKATELGVAALQPLVCERSVLRLDGERAARRREHWSGVAVAAAEQCGRTRLPAVAPVCALADWLAALPAPEGELRWLLSLDAAAASPAQAWACAGGVTRVTVLSGPEGGLTPAEQVAASAAGFVPVGLGPRVLRADTAPLALLAWLALAVPGAQRPSSVGA